MNSIKWGLVSSSPLTNKEKYQITIHLLLLYLSLANISIIKLENYKINMEFIYLHLFFYKNIH